MLRLFIFTAAVVSTAALIGPANAGSDSETSVVVSILPQEEFVARIGDESTRIQVLVQPGHSPATYEPTPKQMAHLAEADLWIRVGVAFENSVLRNVADVAPGLKLIDGTTGIALRAMQPGHSHSHAEPALGAQRMDPHFWLDPLLVKQHARLIAEALCSHSPSACAEYRANLERFESDLDDVHQRLTETLAPVKNRELFVFHPAYGYFADRYGLRQVAVETGGKRPTARQTAKLVDAAQASGAHALFVQPQFSGSSARAIADAIGIDLVELDPLAADYLANLESMAVRIADSYGD